jgi:hypothetical protein
MSRPFSCGKSDNHERTSDTGPSVSTAESAPAFGRCALHTIGRQFFVGHLESVARGVPIGRLKAALPFDVY